ncbi:hypothetical protein [Aquifex sp.]
MSKNFGKKNFFKTFELEEEIRSEGKELINEFLKTLKIFHDMINYILRDLSCEYNSFENLRKFIETSKIVAENWNFIEKDVYSLEDAITYFKNIFDRYRLRKSLKYKGGIFRESINQNKIGRERGYYLLHIIIRNDKDKKGAIIDKGVPLLLVKADDIDESLRESFGDKNLLILE